MIDEEISRVVRESQRHADEILRKDIDILHRMAQELLKYETIDSNDLEKILNGEKLTRALNGRSSQKRRKRQRRRYANKKDSNNRSAKTNNNIKSKSNSPKHKKADIKS